MCQWLYFIQNESHSPYIGLSDSAQSCHLLPSGLFFSLFFLCSNHTGIFIDPWLCQLFCFQSVFWLEESCSRYAHTQLKHLLQISVLSFHLVTYISQFLYILFSIFSQIKHTIVFFLLLFDFLIVCLLSFYTLNANSTCIGIIIIFIYPSTSCIFAIYLLNARILYINSR